MDQVPGSEEAVFQDLLSLSSEQGLSLPLRTTAVDPIASTMSLNAVSDNSEAQIAQHWDQIALRLRQVFYTNNSYTNTAYSNRVFSLLFSDGSNVASRIKVINICIFS